MARARAMAWARARAGAGARARARARARGMARAFASALARSLTTGATLRLAHVAPRLRQPLAGGPTGGVRDLCAAWR